MSVLLYVLVVQLPALNPAKLLDGKELSVEYTQTQLYYLYYYNEGSNNDMFRPYMWAIFRL